MMHGHHTTTKTTREKNTTKEHGSNKTKFQNKHELINHSGAMLLCLISKFTQCLCCLFSSFCVRCFSLCRRRRYGFLVILATHTDFRFVWYPWNNDFWLLDTQFCVNYWKPPPFKAALLCNYDRFDNRYTKNIQHKHNDTHIVFLASIAVHLAARIGSFRFDAASARWVY